MNKTILAAMAIMALGTAALAGNPPSKIAVRTSSGAPTPAVLCPCEADRACETLAPTPPAKRHVFQSPKGSPAVVWR